jgi:asparagine synthase (glutamine-hydrolysing)
MGSVPEPHTIFQSIRAVEAGTSLVIDAHGVHDVLRYYSIAATLKRGVRDVAAAHLVQPPVLLRELVTDSLRHHLIADVPVGAFLSSGIDSSALVALANEATGQPPRTVTLRFEEFLGRESDEAPLAERFARAIGSDHVTRLVTRDEFVADLPRLFDAMDQPTIDGTNTWFVSKAAAERGLKVALSGLGGDELFGSYPSFRDLPRIVRTSRLPLAAAAAGRLTRNPKAGAMVRYGSTWPGAYLLKRGLFLPDDLPTLMGADAAREGLERLAMLEHIASTIDPDPGTPFGRVAALEASLYMRNQLLRDTDWASMAHSLEVRTPLVDATLLRQIAPLLMVEKQRCKHHFAESPRSPLPAWLAGRKKTGFSVPLAEWMRLQADGTSTRMRSWARIVMERWA